MINAWSLLYEELNGTMDKTYPVKNNELNGEDIVINTGTGDTIFNVPSDVNDLDDGNVDSVLFNHSHPSALSEQDEQLRQLDSCLVGMQQPVVLPPLPLPPLKQ